MKLLTHHDDCVSVGGVQMTLTNAQGVNIPVRITDNKDQTFRVEFETTVTGTYTANVTFASLVVPGSPFKVNVVPATSETNNVHVKELPQSTSVCCWPVINDG